jgi:hypothetical protein
MREELLNIPRPVTDIQRDFNVLTCISDYRRVLDWIIRFIDTLQVTTTNNYDTIADLHTINNSALGPLSLYLIAALNIGYSSAVFSLDVSW